MGGCGSEVMLGSGTSLGTGCLVAVMPQHPWAAPGPGWGGSRGHHPGHQQPWDKAVGGVSLGEELIQRELSTFLSQHGFGRPS